jgi:hypothetical protein
MSRGGRASRDKGSRTERAIVRLLQEHGLAGERVPLSGAARGRFGGDISVPVFGRDLRGEAKCRGNGFNRLYDWLEGRDFLVIRADRKPCSLSPSSSSPARLSWQRNARPREMQREDHHR